MSAIEFKSVNFHYHDPYAQVFTDLSLRIDTGWRTALVGRNGRGKTTLLRLINREIPPSKGQVLVPLPTSSFPGPSMNEELTTRSVIRDLIAPFDRWEQEMEELLAVGDESSIACYGEILEAYQNAEGFSIDAMIEREMADIGMDAALLNRPFGTLSGGESTRAAIVALFLKGGHFPLIDEPTNHLDMEGRDILASYLRGKGGFIVVSHDRAFLDECVDHVVSINRSDVRVTQGDFSTWRKQMDIEEGYERRRSTNLQREIRSLEATARQRRSWSQSREGEKRGAYDKGYVGHMAAKIMKRAIHIERRTEAMIEAKKELLQNSETTRDLRIDVEGGLPEVLLSVANLSIVIDGRTIIRDMSFEVRRGERVAIIGPNGCGKTTLLRAIAGEIHPSQGIISLQRHLTTIRSYQIPIWSVGYLRDHLRNEGIDERRFRTIMGAFSVTGEIFDRPLQTFSQGERKKVDLCRSFVASSHLLVWDEPMNYIDLMSREQIEEGVVRHGPTMLFVEHDRWFVESVATRVIEMQDNNTGT